MSKGAGGFCRQFGNVDSSERVQEGVDRVKYVRMLSVPETVHIHSNNNQTHTCRPSYMSIDREGDGGGGGWGGGVNPPKLRV